MPAMGVRIVRAAIVPRTVAEAEEEGAVIVGAVAAVAAAEIVVLVAEAAEEIAEIAKVI
jgi:hypothetical protein